MRTNVVRKKVCTLLSTSICLSCYMSNFISEPGISSFVGLQLPYLTLYVKHKSRDSARTPSANRAIVRKSSERFGVVRESGAERKRHLAGHQGTSVQGGSPCSTDFLQWETNGRSPKIGEMNKDKK
jgi:hypothetical protein